MRAIHGANAKASAFITLSVCSQTGTLTKLLMLSCALSDGVGSLQKRLQMSVNSAPMRMICKLLEYCRLYCQKYMDPMSRMRIKRRLNNSDCLSGRVI